MTLDTEGQAPAPAPETQAPAPEAKAPETADIFKEELSEAEKLEAAEREELRKVYRKSQAEREATREPEEEEKPSNRDPKTGQYKSLKEEVQTGDDDDEKPKAKEPEAKTKSPDQKQIAPKAEEAKKPAVEAPKHWSDRQKAAFAKLDAEEQELFAREANEARQNLSRQGRALQEMQPVAKVLQEHKALFEQNGMSYDQGIAALLRAQAALSNPNTAKDALLTLAKNYNIDLSDGAEPEDGEWVDPNVARLTQHVTELQNRLAHYERQTAEQLQEQKSVAATSFVEQFAQGKDDFEALADDIFARVKMYRAAYPDAPHDQVLAKAYEEARMLNPATQEKLLAEKQREQAAKVEQARRAAALAVQSEPDPSTATSEREMMRRIYRKNHAA